MGEQVSEAKDRFIAEFRAFSRNGAGGAPEWLQAIRTAAIGQFEAAGFPTSRDERWRFTSVKRLAEVPYRLHQKVDSGISLNEVVPYLLGAGTDQRIVFVNGRYSTELSNHSRAQNGVSIGSLSSLSGIEARLLEANLAKYASPLDSPFTALNTAFIADGAIVHVPRGVVVEEPIQILHLTSPAEEPTVRHPRNLIVLESGASAIVVEQYVGLSEIEYWSNVVTELVLGEDSRLSLYRVQREGESGNHTAVTHSHQGRSSEYRLTTIELGGALSRHDINAVLDGEGAECSLYGLSQLQGRQHVDHHTNIFHARPNCRSWELFNGIYDEQARGVFTGRIVVKPGAQKTDSKQTNNNLLLSDSARADSQPQLEIYADDVKCTHGATLGPIDERALFYFQSRGIEAEAARNLITYGFGVEILNQIGIQELRESLDEVLHARLDQGAERRRQAG